MLKILIAEPSVQDQQDLQMLIEQVFHTPLEVICIQSFKELKEALEKMRFDLIFAQDALLKQDLTSLQQHPIVVTTQGHTDISQDVLYKPFCYEMVQEKCLHLLL